MGYVLRVRFASFFTGAALASAAGLYFLKKDYNFAHHAISQQMNTIYGTLEGRVLALEKMKEAEEGRVLALEKLKEEVPSNHVDTSAA